MASGIEVIDGKAYMAVIGFTAAGVPIVPVEQGDLSLIKEQADYVTTLTYLDAGLADERVETVIHSSVILGISATETLVYLGVPGKYRVSTITVS